MMWISWDCFNFTSAPLPFMGCRGGRGRGRGGIWCKSASENRKAAFSQPNKFTLSAPGRGPPPAQVKAGAKVPSPTFVAGCLLGFPSSTSHWPLMVFGPPPNFTEV